MTVQRAKEVTIVSYEGHLDLLHSDNFEKQFTEATGQRQKIVLDLGGCGHIDSTGVGVLLKIYHRFEDRTSGLAIANCRKLKQMLKVSGLNRSFDIFPTVEDAIASFN